MQLWLTDQKERRISVGLLVPFTQTNKMSIQWLSIRVKPVEEEEEFKKISQKSKAHIFISVKSWCVGPLLKCTPNAILKNEITRILVNSLVFISIVVRGNIDYSNCTSKYIFHCNFSKVIFVLTTDITKLKKNTIIERFKKFITNSLCF